MVGSLRQQKGFATLVEMIVATLIVFWVIASGYALTVFAMRTETSVADRQQLQSGVRLLEDFVRRELRYAHDVALRADMPDSVSNDDESVYVGLRVVAGMPVRLVRRDKSGTTLVPVGAVDGLEFEILVNEGPSIVLRTTILSGLTYESVSDVLLLNTQEDAIPGFGNVIIYRVTSPVP